MNLVKLLTIGHYLRKSRFRRNVNVNSNERIASTLGGLALGLFAMRRRSWVGRLLTGATAGMLAERGLTGRCRAYNALGLRST